MKLKYGKTCGTISRMAQWGLGGSSRSETNYELWASHLASLSVVFICRSEDEGLGQWLGSCALLKFVSSGVMHGKGVLNPCSKQRNCFDWIFILKHWIHLNFQTGFTASEHLNTTRVDCFHYLMVTFQYSKKVWIQFLKLIEDRLYARHMLGAGRWILYMA